MRKRRRAPLSTSDTPWLSSDCIEGKAEALLREYEQRFGRVSHPPVPIELLVETHLGLGLDWCEIPDDRNGPILARLNSEELTIELNEAHKPLFEEYIGPFQFTLAHEAGHWVLHVPSPEAAAQLSMFGQASANHPFLCRGKVPGKKDRREWQADRFAAALMMPEQMMRSFCAQINVLSWPGLYAIRDAFEASLSAVKYRVSELGLAYVSEGGQIFASQEEAAGQTTFH